MKESDYLHCKVEIKLNCLNCLIISKKYVTAQKSSINLKYWKKLYSQKGFKNKCNILSSDDGELCTYKSKASVNCVTENMGGNNV